MKYLKKKLAQLNAKSETNEIRHLMTCLADDLLKSYHIQKGTDEYFLVNIEFYFCNKYHPDIITYPRELEEGKWFFHQSGIDLTFKSSYSPYDGDNKTVDITKDYFFGGILIREILKKNNMEVLLDGPYKCEWELFDQFDALSPSINEMPRLVRNANRLSVTMQPKRRKFSYTPDMLKKKYSELADITYRQKCPIAEDCFYKYIYNEKLAFYVSRDELQSTLKSL